MALPRTYDGQNCAIARSLEIIGERWTLLIVRDAFYGVTRFVDFRDHLDIPRAVLAERLALLVEHEVLTRVAGTSGRDEYALTAKGRRLWPVVWSLSTWGNAFYVQDGERRLTTHAACDTPIAADASCPNCRIVPDVAELILQPRPVEEGRRTDPVSVVLEQPHRMLEPIAVHA